jgi:RNA polymerase sigma-70 factor (ECF subfamily)
VDGGQTEAVEAHETAARVEQALGRLSDEYREVVVLRYFAELSYEEISQAVGVPEKTVKSRLFSARQRLAGLLGREGNRTT